MKKLISLALLTVFLGCSKDGKDGAPGKSFTSSMVNLSGTVTSNTQSINVPGLNISRGDILAVYTCIGTACESVNIWQAGISNNIFYVVQGSVVTINGALAGLQTLWYINALERI